MRVLAVVPAFNEEEMAPRAADVISALLEQANSLALSLQLLHSEPFEYKRSLLERLERLDVVHLSLGDAPNPARQAQDERALYLRDRLRKNLNSIETDLDTREMLDRGPARACGRQHEPHPAPSCALDPCVRKPGERAPGRRQMAVRGHQQRCL